MRAASERTTLLDKRHFASRRGYVGHAHRAFGRVPVHAHTIGLSTMVGMAAIGGGLMLPDEVYTKAFEILDPELQ